MKHLIAPYSKFSHNRSIINCLFLDVILSFVTDSTVAFDIKESLSPLFDVEDMANAALLLGIKIVRPSSFY